MRDPVDPRTGRGEALPGFDPLRTERWIAAIRLLVIGVVAAIYLIRGAEHNPPSLLALTILSLAAVYGAWSLVAFTDIHEPSLRVRVLTTAVDTLLVTLWVWATGGPSSEYWALYLVVIMSTAMRFDLRGTILASIATAVLYVDVVTLGGGLPWPFLLNRTALMLISGFAAGILAQQRLLHRRRGMELEELAAERSRELDTERAEVDRLRKVDVAKSEFVAVAAHDIRTPLAAVIGVLATLQEHGSELSKPERDGLIDGALDQATRLARLVEDLLTVARIEDGVVSLTLQSVDPRDLLSEAATTSGMGHRLIIEIGRVGQVRCDPDAAIRVLTNLLDNARKYGPTDAKIHIKVAEDDRMVRFSVRDEGPGIPAEERAGIFERFRRIDDGGRRSGSGLGLYICRGLVEAHGGATGVDDAPEGGTRFWFTLPRALGVENRELGEPVDEVHGGLGSGEVTDEPGAGDRPQVPSAL